MIKRAWKNTEIHQSLMNEAYDLWQKPENNNWASEEFINNLPSQAHKDAVILGNLNYQVGNGGFQQWYDNGLGHRDEEYLIGDLLPRIKTETANKVISLIIDASELQREIEEYNNEEGEDERLYEQFDSLDSAYYELDDQFMEEVETYLQGLSKEGSQREAKSPPGRKHQVEKLKEEGMPEEMAFGIAWNQHKKHGKPKKKKKSSLQFLQETQMKPTNGTLKFSEEDYAFYNDSHRFDSEVRHECEDCGAPGAKLYNASGQKLQIGGFSSDLELCDHCHQERFPNQYKEDEIGRITKLRDRARERRDGKIGSKRSSNMNKTADAYDNPINPFNPVIPKDRSSADTQREARGFQPWFEENKNSDLLWEEYNNYRVEAKQGGMPVENFHIWMREKYDTTHYSSKKRNKEKEKIIRTANGVALHILPDLFEDKFPMRYIPAELRLLRAKAKQALTGVIQHIQILGRERTPADFPMEWFYGKLQSASTSSDGRDYNNYVTQVRAQLQDILDYANRSTGENFYANMKTTVEKFSKHENGVIIIRELIDNKINKYGFINEQNQFVVLPNHQELRTSSIIQRPDSGETLRIVGYRNVSLGSTALMVEALMKKKAFNDKNLPVGTPEWVNAVLNSASPLDWELSKRDIPEGAPGNLWGSGPRKSEKLSVTDLLLDAAMERGVKAMSPDAVKWYDDYYNSPFYQDKISSIAIKEAMKKIALDVSDEIPPMGWDASTPGKPAGSGAPKPPTDALNKTEEEENNQGNTLYDSTKDTGPQYQVTVNPKSNEVTVKTLQSPEIDALNKAMNTNPQTPGQEGNSNLPTLNTTPPAQGQQPSGQEKFKDQEIPVMY